MTETNVKSKSAAEHEYPYMFKKIDRVLELLDDELAERFPNTERIKNLSETALNLVRAGSNSKKELRLLWNDEDAG